MESGAARSHAVHGWGLRLAHREGLVPRFQLCHTHRVEQLREDLIGAPIDTAARVVDVPTQRLRRWARIGLLAPSASQRSFTYTFDDLVTGRIVRELEDKGVHVRHIMVIVDVARTATAAPLSSLRWAVATGEAFVQLPNEQWVGDRHPEQSVIPEVLDLEEIRAKTRSRLKRPHSSAGATEHRRGRQSGAEVFAGTRIPVDTIRGYIRAGFTDDRILVSFPALFPEDVSWARRTAPVAS